MTRLLERLERLAHLDRFPRPRRTADSQEPAPATTGFRDCRGHWHAWEDAS